MARWKRRFRKRKRKSLVSKYKKKLTKGKTLASLTKLAFVGVIVVSLLSFIVFPLFAFNLPSPDKIVRREGFSTKILDRDGDVLYDIYANQRRTPVELEEVPEDLKEATIAIEDKNFYKHEGFDPLGMIRGASRLFTRGRAQGGSTLTQQLVKNVLLTPERSVFRKIREFILAVQIERRYDKDEILRMYLNEAPYGGTAWGVEAASEMYFGKKVKELNLVESAILAGMPQRPSVYSPYSSTPDAYIERTKEVLRRMREDGFITKEEEDEAVSELADYQFQERGADFKAPHFVMYVKKLLEDRYGERVVEQGGLTVTTTLDIDLQEEAQSIVKSEIDKVKSLRISNGAAVAMDPETGEILAMVGSRGFEDPEIDGQVNVTTALRQPGSAIKPITYVTAFGEGYTPATLLMDVPTEFPGGAGQPMYEPVNYDGEYRGPTQVRYALANSINVAAVKMLALVGIRDTLQTAYDLGIESLEPTDENMSRLGLSMTLGGGEVTLLSLTKSYSAFMNEGHKVEPVSILKVVDGDGKVLEENRPRKGRRVISEQNAFLIADILSDNQARAEIFGTNSLLNIPGHDVAVKTGTTNDQRDNWTVGGNGNVVVGVWVGNNDNSPMLQVASGVTGASPIWRRIVLEALSDKPSFEFQVPDGVTQVAVDRVSGYRAHDGFPSRQEYFARGTEPTGEDPVHTMLKVCRNEEDKLAPPSYVSSGNYDEKEYFVFKVDDPVSTDGVNRWQGGIDAWISTQPDSRYHPPTQFCGSGNPVNVEFINPKDRTSNLPNKFTVRIDPVSTSSIVQVELEINGTKVRTFTGPPFEYEADLEDGVHTLRAKAKDEEGNESDRRITIGVNSDWDAEE